MPSASHVVSTPAAVLSGPMVDARADVRRFWAYAATFGAAWGVFEVTVGTFLHTLRVPLSGHLLALVSIAILVAERQLLPARGLTLATGIVAAMCKAISPSGIILGPMLGIVLEALLVELVLLAAPRAWISAAMAGALAALWPLTQKILTQLLFYGGTVLELYLEALRRLAQALGVSSAQGLGVGAAALAAVSLLGMSAALLGKLLGDRVAPPRAQGEPATAPGAAGRPDRGAAVRLGVPASRAQLADPTPRWLLPALARRRDLLVALAALAAVAGQAAAGLLLPLAGLGGLLLALGLLRPRALQRLWRPRFWTFTLALAGLSGLLLGERDIGLLGLTGPVLSSTGARAGLLMVTGGALVFALTSWASVALNRGRVLTWAQRVGLGQLGQAVSAALGLMPALEPWLRLRRGERGTAAAPGGAEDRAPDAAVRPPAAPTPLRRRGPGRLIEIFMRVLAEAVRLAEQAASQEGAVERRPRVVALVGARGSGKSNAVQRLHRRLCARGIAAAGICQPAWEGRRGYDLLDLESGQRHGFAEKHGQSSAPAGPEGAAAAAETGVRPALGFRFDDAGWRWAAERLGGAWSRVDALLVDELGRLEAVGGGHLETLLPLLAGQRGSSDDEQRHPALLILAVQEAVAAEVAQQVGGFDVIVALPVSTESLDALAAALGDRESAGVAAYARVTASAPS